MVLGSGQFTLCLMHCSFRNLLPQPCTARHGTAQHWAAPPSHASHDPEPARIITPAVLPAVLVCLFAWI